LSRNPGTLRREACSLPTAISYSHYPLDLDRVKCRFTGCTISGLESHSWA